MTNIRTLPEFIEELSDGYVESKENPEEWYVLIGSRVGNYSVNAADMPDDYDEAQQELPVEDRDATENVDGHFQIGTSGWAEQAFEDTSDLVSDYVGSRGHGKLDTALLDIIVVHEDLMSEEALEVADEADEPPEAEA